MSTPTQFELALAAALRNHLPQEFFLVAMERLKGVGEAYDRAFPDQSAQRIAELERENAELREEIKDAGMKALSVALEAYTRDLQDLKAENAELRADKERLDCLAKHCTTVHSGNGRTYYIWRIEHNVLDIRAAIDAARANV